MNTWKPIVGFEGLYEVSSNGQIRSLARVRKMRNLGGPYERLWKGKVLRPQKDRYGYMYIPLTDGDGVCKKYKVHTLVAAAFVGPCPADKNQINHKDGLKCNNRAGNLEWCTNSENHKHSYKMGTHALNLYRDKKTGRNSGVRGHGTG